MFRSFLHGFLSIFSWMTPPNLPRVPNYHEGKDLYAGFKEDWAALRGDWERICSKHDQD